jgi:hypothetical protein
MPEATRHYIHETKSGQITFLPQAKAWAKRRKEGGYVYHATQGYIVVEYDLDAPHEVTGWRIHGSPPDFARGTLAGAKRELQGLVDDGWLDDHRYEVCLGRKRRSYIDEFVGWAQRDEADRLKYLAEERLKCLAGERLKYLVEERLKLLAEG